MIIQKWKEPINFDITSLLFTNNGYGRRFARIDSHLKKDAFASFGLNPLLNEPIFGDFLGNHYLNGAHTHRHIDTAPYGYHHVRCNWMISKPNTGGDVIINDILFKPQIGDLWICIASKYYHESTPINGGERLILSFGALIKKENLNEFTKY